MSLIYPISLSDLTIELLSKNLMKKQEKLMTKNNMIQNSDNEIGNFCTKLSAHLVLAEAKNTIEDF